MLSINRISLNKPLADWISKSIENLKAQSIEFTHKVAVQAYELAALHQDPADRVLISTARIMGATLMTADRRILAYTEVDRLDASL